MNPTFLKRPLLAFCGTALALLLMFTIRASMVRSVFDNASLMSDVWFQATLLDAYLGFLFAFAWIAWKEQTPLRQFVWFLLIMALGNMALAVYVALQIFKLPPNSSVGDILQRSPSARV